MINFQQTANETVLPAATKVLNESISHSQNASRLGDLQIDSSSVVVAGEKLETISYKETQLVGHVFWQANSQMSTHVGKY